MNAIIVILSKEDSPGLVKTRLGATIGLDRAAKVHRILCFHTLSVALSSDLPVYVSLAGNTSGHFANEITATGAKVIEQPNGDLGHKIYSAMQLGERVIVLGTDTPNIQTASLLEAAAATEIILGPTSDGGYWLIAGNKPPASIFKNIPWSTSSVLQKSIEEIKRHDLQYRLISTLNDVDHYEDLHTILSDPSTPPALKEHLKPYARS